MILPIDDLEYISSRVKWDELRNSKVLITGGTGFIGSWLEFHLTMRSKKHYLSTQQRIFGGILRDEVGDGGCASEQRGFVYLRIQ